MLAEVKNEAKSLVVDGRFARQKFAEITIASTGEKVFFNTNTKDRTKAVKSTLEIVRCLEEEHGRVFWKFRDEEVIQFGSTQPSFADKAKKAVLDFFDLA